MAATLPVKGVEAEVYKKLHNDEIKLISSMSNEEIQDRIRELERIELESRVRQQTAVIELEDRIKKLDKEAAAKLRERDKQYRVKEVPVKTAKDKASEKAKSNLDEAMEILKNNALVPEVSKAETLVKLLKAGFSIPMSLKLIYPGKDF